MRINSKVSAPNIDVQFTATYYKQIYDESARKYDIDFSSPLVNNVLKVTVNVNNKPVPIDIIEDVTNDWKAVVLINKPENVGTTTINDTTNPSTGKLRENLDVNTSITIEAQVTVYRKNDKAPLGKETYYIEKTVVISCEPQNNAGSKTEGSVNLYGLSNVLNLTALINSNLNDKIPIVTTCKYHGVPAHHKATIEVNGVPLVDNDTGYVIPSFNNNPVAFVPIGSLKRKNNIKAVITPCDYEYNEKQKSKLLELWEANKNNTRAVYNPHISEGRTNIHFNFLSSLGIAPTRENRGRLYRCTFNAHLVGAPSDAKVNFSIYPAVGNQYNSSRGLGDIFILNASDPENTVVDFVFTITDAMINMANVNNLCLCCWTKTNYYLKCSNLRIVEADVSTIAAEELWMKLHKEKTPSKEVSSNIKPITIYNHFDVVIPPIETYLSIASDKIIATDELQIDGGKVKLYPAIKMAGKEIMGDDLLNLFNVNVYVDTNKTIVRNTYVEYDYNDVVGKNISISVEPKF